MENITTIRTTCSSKDLTVFLQSTKDCEWINTGKFLGKGKFGTVYQVCCKGECQFIAKYIEAGSRTSKRFLQVIEEEIEMQNKFATYHFASPILEAFICKDKAYLISIKKDMTVLEYIKLVVDTHDELEATSIISQLQEDTKQLFFNAYQQGFIHTDPHLDNIMIDFKAGGGYQNVQFIDLDAAVIRSKSRLSQKEIDDILEGVEQSFSMVYKDALRMKSSGLRTAKKAPEAPSKKRRPQTSPRKQRSKSPERGGGVKGELRSLTTPKKKNMFEDDELMTTPKKKNLFEDDDFSTPKKKNLFEEEDDEPMTPPLGKAKNIRGKLF